MSWKIFTAKKVRTKLMQNIDYRCADGKFQQSTCGVTILNSRSVSSSEREVRNGISSWKERLISPAERQEAIGGF